MAENDGANAAAIRADQAMGPISRGGIAPQPLFAVGAVLLGSFLANFDSRLTSVGLADLRGAFSLGFDEGAWLSTAGIGSQIFYLRGNKKLDIEIIKILSSRREQWIQRRCVRHRQSGGSLRTYGGLLVARRAGVGISCRQTRGRHHERQTDDEGVNAFHPCNSFRPQREHVGLTDG